jgi:hypothetical protein
VERPFERRREDVTTATGGDVTTATGGEDRLM